MKQYLSDDKVSPVNIKQFIKDEYSVHLCMIWHTMMRTLPIEIGFQLLTVHCLIHWTIINLHKTSMCTQLQNKYFS